MDAKARIRELMQERGWSEYRLAIASGLSQSTVANIFNRNTTPCSYLLYLVYEAMEYLPYCRSNSCL